MRACFCTRQADGHASFIYRSGDLEIRTIQPGIDGHRRTCIELCASMQSVHVRRAPAAQLRGSLRSPLAEYSSPACSSSGRLCSWEPWLPKKAHRCSAGPTSARSPRLNCHLTYSFFRLLLTRAGEEREQCLKLTLSALRFSLISWFRCHISHT